MKGYIRKRGDNKWQIEIDIGRSPDGKRLKKIETVQGTKKEAQAKMTELVHQINNNTFIMPERMTVGNFFDYWLDTYVKQNLATSTIESYSMIIRKHLTPSIGHIELQKILPIHIQEYYSKALRTGLSAKTVNYHHRIMHKIFDNALKLQLVSRNIIEAVEAPKPKKYRANFLDVKEVEKLRKVIVDTKFKVPVNLAVLLGLRRGEVFGLKWDDIDFGKKLLIVKRELLPTKEGLIFKEGTKNGSLHRVINLPEILIPILKKHKIRQAENKMKLGECYQDNNLVCAREDGSPVNPGTFSHYFADMLADKNLPQVRFHDLRHTAASLLLSMNVPAKVTSELLGHSTIGITMDLYSHVMPTMRKEAADKLDRLFQRKK